MLFDLIYLFQLTSSPRIYPPLRVAVHPVEIHDVVPDVNQRFTYESYETMYAAEFFQKIIFDVSMRCPLKNIHTFANVTVPLGRD